MGWLANGKRTSANSRNIMTMNRKNTRQIFSVSQLNHAVKGLLEENFGLVWIQGEVSNLARPSSGHIYFSLKDRNAQVRCAMFRAKNSLVNFNIENGVEVVARARVGMYEARGEYQLIVEALEPAGDGLLRMKFEELKHKLSLEGLFDEDNKFELPKYPRQIGVITSPTGAALQDILSTLKRRNSAVPVVIYPTAVQGESAKHEIVRALEAANRRDECDLLIVARGGGSLEDLWSFNEEIVVRAIYESEIPIISGIGHEIDFTLADFTADVRAPTPTAAAEISTTPLDAMLHELESLQVQLCRQLEQLIKHGQQQLLLQKSRLQHPGERIEQLFQRADDLTDRLPRALKNLLALKVSRTNHLSTLLHNRSPSPRIGAYTQNCQQQVQRLSSACFLHLTEQRAALSELERTLGAVSPNATLARGYAIISDAKKQIVRNADDYQIGNELDARLAKGSLKVTIKEIDDGD